MLDPCDSFNTIEHTEVFHALNESDLSAKIQNVKQKIKVSTVKLDLEKLMRMDYKLVFAQFLKNRRFVNYSLKCFVGKKNGCIFVQ